MIAFEFILGEICYSHWWRRKSLILTVCSCSCGVAVSGQLPRSFVLNWTKWEQVCSKEQSRKATASYWILFHLQWFCGPYEFKMQNKIFINNQKQTWLTALPKLNASFISESIQPLQKNILPTWAKPPFRDDAMKF